jgi:hypothetical protein
MDEFKVGFGNEAINEVRALDLWKSMGIDADDNECYWNPKHKVNKSKDMFNKLYDSHYIKKDTSFTSTSGGTYTNYGLLPVMPDLSIIDTVVPLTPLVGLLPRRAVTGRAYVYNKQTAKPLANFEAEESAAESVKDTYTATALIMKVLRTYGKVTGLATRAASGYINLQSESIRSRLLAMNQALENEIINGSTSTNAYGFDGLITSITTHATDLGGVNVELQDIRDLYAAIQNQISGTTRMTPGFPTIAVTDASTMANLKGKLLDYQRFIDKPTSADMLFGILDSFKFDQLTFIYDQFMPATSGSRRIILIDPVYVFLAVLQEITYEELAKDGDWNKYMLKWYGSLAITYEASCGQLYGIL